MKKIKNKVKKLKEGIKPDTDKKISPETAGNVGSKNLQNRPRLDTIDEDVKTEI